MKRKLALLKNYLYENRATITYVGTCMVFLALMIRNAKHLNSFLKEHDLYDEYYQEM